MSPRGSPSRPRRLGLLTRHDARAEPQRRRYPYDVGERIGGDFTVIGHLGMGRVAYLYQVWSAEDWCAYTCKILSPQLREDQTASAALRREARILKRLNHPNIVRSFREGGHDGLPFLVMEYLEGPSIFDVLENQPDRRLPLADAIRTAVHIGAGVFHLHQNGYLHLDLKPANLLLRSNVPVLVDFDAARRSSLETRTSRPLGTDPYMSPEQVRREAPGVASDVYGLGAVLYELLSGRWPYEAVYQGEESRQGEEERYPQLGRRPPPPVREFNGDVPPALNRIVMRCLAHDPAQRFDSVHQLLLELTGQLEGTASLWPEGVQTERRARPRD